MSDKQHLTLAFPDVLQACYDAYDTMMAARRGFWSGVAVYEERYRRARAAAVSEGYAPVTPPFDVGDEG